MLKIAFNSGHHFIRRISLLHCAYYDVQAYLFFLLNIHRILNSIHVSLYRVLQNPHRVYACTIIILVSTTEEKGKEKMVRETLHCICSWFLSNDLSQNRTHFLTCGYTAQLTSVLTTFPPYCLNYIWEQSGVLLFDHTIFFRDLTTWLLDFDLKLVIFWSTSPG